MIASELLAQTEGLGIRLAVTPDNNLKINAPKGTLTLDIKRDLAAHKAELIALLSHPGFGSYDDVVETVKVIGDELAEKTQQDWTLTLVPTGYTHAQRIADLGLKAADLGVKCSVCRYKKAVVLWIGAQPYCRDCQDKEKARSVARTRETSQ